MEILIIFLINVLLFFTDLKSSKKMNNVENVSFKEFKKKISLYGSLAELHFKLMKILCFITYDQSSYYCFCDKYDSAELNYNRGRQCCALSRTQIEFANFEELLDKNQFNESFQNIYLNLLLPYLIECFNVDKQSIGLFF